jgi:hypothetical protein
LWLGISFISCVECGAFCALICMHCCCHKDNGPAPEHVDSESDPDEAKEDEEKKDESDKDDDEGIYGANEGEAEPPKIAE